jgi:hypothetical protein
MDVERSIAAADTAMKDLAGPIRQASGSSGETWSRGAHIFRKRAGSLILSASERRASGSTAGKT